MTDKDNNNRESEAAKSELGTPEDIESLARDYFESEFPNPERENCPPRDELLGIARSGRLPDDDLRAHLFSCSECFNEFRVAVLQKTSVSKKWRQGLFSISDGHLRPVLTMIAIVAAFIVVAIVLLRKSTEPHRTGLEQVGGVSLGTPVVASPSIESSPAAGSAPVSPAMVTTVVDLRGYIALGNVQRDADRAGQESMSIRVAAVRMSLRLRLPEGSESGVYTISVLDRASLKTLISAKGGSASGESVETTLNLEQLASGEYVLRIALHGEAPSDYSMVVYRR